jgi:hypothetical protein
MQFKKEDSFEGKKYLMSLALAEKVELVLADRPIISMSYS